MDVDVDMDTSLGSGSMHPSMDFIWIRTWTQGHPRTPTQSSLELWGLGSGAAVGSGAAIGPGLGSKESLYLCSRSCLYKESYLVTNSYSFYSTCPHSRTPPCARIHTGNHICTQERRPSFEFKFVKNSVCHPFSLWSLLKSSSIFPEHRRELWISIGLLLWCAGIFLCLLLWLLCAGFVLGLLLWLWCLGFELSLLLCL